MREDTLALWEIKLPAAIAQPPETTFTRGIRPHWSVAGCANKSLMN
jgi:hypothetical protein